MKRSLLLISCLFFLNAMPYAQAPGGRIFKPVDYRTVIVGQECDTTLPLQKVLLLTDDNYFFFKDHTSGSCWTWIEATGKWRQQQDTIFLDWKDAYWNPDSTILTTKYILVGEALVYNDTSEQYITRNWGKFKLLKEVRNFQTDLKENDEIATWARSYAAYLECLKKFNWASNFEKKYNTQYLLIFRRWMSAEKLLKDKDWENLSLDEVKDVLNIYETIWEEKK